MDFTDTLQKGCRKLDIAVSDQEAELLATFYRELIKWNSKMNLVSRAAELEIIESHFLDSLTLLPHIENQTQTLLDVGTGAGFPGLVLKACFPGLRLTLVEPRSKRVTFLRHIVRTLQLDHVEILAQRLEPQPPEINSSRHPYITSRAVSQIHEFLDLVSSHCPSGGTVLCMKGPKADEEIQSWQNKSPSSPFTLTDRIQKILPYSQSIRNLIFFRRK